MKPYYESERGTLFHADCLEVMNEMETDSIDSLITDPPYGFSFMGKEWDYEVPSVEIWRECLRVLKPGAHALIFAGSRTQHRMAVNVEDAGFILKDCLMYMYGSGFPKSHNFGCKCSGKAVPYSHNTYIGDYDEKAESKAKYDLRSMQNTHLQTTFDAQGESGKILQQSLPKQSISTYGKKGTESETSEKKQSGMEGRSLSGAEKRLCNDKKTASFESETKRICAGAHPSSRKNTEKTFDANGRSSPYKPRPNGQQAGKSSNIQKPFGALEQRTSERCPICKGLKDFKGFGTALKPSYEPILLCMKPNDGTYANNALKHGVAGLNIEGCRIGAEERKNRAAGNKASGNSLNMSLKGMPKNIAPTLTKGRYPANVILDDEAAALLDQQSGFSKSGRKRKGQYAGGVFGGGLKSQETEHQDQGGASRFFYTSKASAAERDGATHPTIKPLKLMEWLCNLTKTPTGGVVLDPFAGSGTTALACHSVGRPWILIEREEEYCEIAAKRVEAVANQKTFEDYL